MGIVTLERVQPGMVASAPVTDRRGRLLIPADVPLTERHIQALQVWGVAHIEVEGEPSHDEVQSSLDPEQEAQLRAEIDERFGAYNANHPVLEALRECAFQRASRAERSARP